MAEPLVFDSLAYQVRNRTRGRERPSARAIPFFSFSSVTFPGGRRDQ